VNFSCECSYSIFVFVFWQRIKICGVTKHKNLTCLNERQYVYPMQNIYNFFGNGYFELEFQKGIYFLSECESLKCCGPRFHLICASPSGLWTQIRIQEGQTQKAPKSRKIYVFEGLEESPGAGTYFTEA
jgi:hypothetical protein